MKNNLEYHRRRSIRLPGYDYSQAGVYFVTVCTQNRGCLFGDITDGEMRLNNAGRMVHKVWDELPVYYRGVDIDEFAVMPNHIHGIINIVGAGPRACPNNPRACPELLGQPQGVARTESSVDGVVVPTGLSLPDVVHRFKTMTTKKYSDGVKQCGWPLFPGRLWQRNYWEHTVRNEPELNRIREYILNNPKRWEMDDLFMGIL